MFHTPVKPQSLYKWLKFLFFFQNIAGDQAVSFCQHIFASLCTQNDGQARHNAPIDPNLDLKSQDCTKRLEQSASYQSIDGSHAVTPRRMSILPIIAQT